MATEEPEYAVESKFERFEIRSYGPVVVAETQIDSGFEEAGNQAFRILAGYIFGGNKARTQIKMTAPVTQEPRSEKIAMTAPVTQQKADGGYWVQFTMPKQYSLETLPTPNDARVKLRVIKARKVAVFTYSGSWSEANFQEKLAEFRSDLKKNNITAVGDPTLARFNSPFQLWFLRRNEIWISIAQ